jgi:hypothetical protein
MSETGWTHIEHIFYGLLVFAALVGFGYVFWRIARADILGR